MVRLRDNAYLNFVRSQPCAACGKPGPSDPHHFMNGGGGMGRKPDDYFTTPLCRACHESWHSKRYLPCYQPPNKQDTEYQLAVVRSMACMFESQARLLAHKLRAETGSSNDEEPDLF